MRGARALWMLEFYPASDPPDDDIAVLASDGENVDIAIHDSGRCQLNVRTSEGRCL
jgi:hypothetical protein